MNLPWQKVVHDEANALGFPDPKTHSPQVVIWKVNPLLGKVKTLAQSGGKGFFWISVQRSQVLEETADAGKPDQLFAIVAGFQRLRFLLLPVY